MHHLRYYWLPAWLALLANDALAAPLATPGDNDLQRQRQEQLLREQRQRLEELAAQFGLCPAQPLQAAR